MSVTPATAAASQSVSTTVETLFDPTVSGCDGDASGIMIGNQSGSAATLFVNVAGIHHAGDYMPIYAGASVEFKGGRGIGKVTAKTASGTATIDFGLTARVLDI